MEIQHADPALRRRVALILGPIGLLLVAALITFQWWLRALSAQMDLADFVVVIVHTLRVTYVLLAMVLLVLAVYLIARGRRIIADRRYPARDARVIRDTPVRLDDDAVRIGNWCIRGGILCITLAVFIPTVGWLALSKLG